MTASRDLSRAGLWAAGPRELTLPINAKGLSEITTASGSLLITPDYDVMAWICERWLRRPTESGWMRPSYYEIGCDLYSGPPSGKDYRSLRAALRRLAGVRLTLHRFNAETGKADPRWDHDTYLLEASRPTDTPQGLDRPAVRLAEWLRREIDHGAPLRLDWRVLRSFHHRQLLAKRLWIYLAAERWKREGDSEASWIAVGDRLFAALGMDYAEHRKARRALGRACETVRKVDPRLGAGEVYLRSQGKRWQLVARRPTEAAWSRQRAERESVRETIRGSLAAAK